MMVKTKRFRNFSIIPQAASVSSYHFGMSDASTGSPTMLSACLIRNKRENIKHFQKRASFFFRNLLFSILRIFLREKFQFGKWDLQAVLIFSRNGPVRVPVRFLFGKSSNTNVVPFLNCRYLLKALTNRDLQKYEANPRLPVRACTGSIVERLVADPIFGRVLQCFVSILSTPHRYCTTGSSSGRSLLCWTVPKAVRLA